MVFMMRSCSLRNEVARLKKQKEESPLQGILKFAELEKGQLGFAVILSVLSSAFGIFPYIAVAIILSSVLTGELTVNLAVFLTLAALAGYVCKGILYAKSTMCSHKAAYEIIRNIRCRIMEKMAKVSMGTVQQKSSGEYKQLIIDDAERLEYPLAHAIPELTAAILVPAFVVIYLLTIDWRMALAALLPSVLGAIVYYSMVFGRREVMKEYMESNAAMNSAIVEYVNGMEVIKAFDQSTSPMDRLKASILKVRDITLKWYRHCWPFMSTGEAIMPSAITFVLPIGMLLIFNDHLTLSELIVCILLSMSISSSLQKMMEFMENLAAINEIQPRIQALLDMQEMPVPEQPEHIRGGDIALHDVHFGYGNAEVIQGVSLKAKTGTVTALVGPSGSGKSTLAKLIARFWDVNDGVISIDGKDIRNLSLQELEEHISYVSQDNFLFHMSLRENIRIGRPEATDEEVERAAREAGCGDFLTRFPQGLNTDAGDAGTRLSGGERQRLAIARAILKDAPIIILDEASAFIDPENEDKLQQSISRLTKGKTLIVVAHRLSTIMYADQICVLENGKITAHGTHEQLLLSSHTYQDMWKAHISTMEWMM